MARTVAVAFVGVILLAACGGPAPSAGSASPETTAATAEESKQHMLKLEVTGTAVLSSLTFTLDGKVSEEKAVRLPWRKTVAVPYGSGRHEWKLTMRHGGGELSGTATVDGMLLTQTASSGSPGSNSTANLSGSFEG